MEITKDSHLDHNLTRSQVEYIQKKFANRDSFFIETIDLEGTGLGLVPCGLHGPLTGDEPVPEEEVVYLKRGDRPYPSRTCSRKPKMTSKVAVIAGPHEAELCILYTAFGGPVAPKEPGDPSLEEGEPVRESAEFWAEHALTKE